MGAVSGSHQFVDRLLPLPPETRALRMCSACLNSFGLKTRDKSEAFANHLPTGIFHMSPSHNISYIFILYFILFNRPSCPTMERKKGCDPKLLHKKACGTGLIPLIPLMSNHIDTTKYTSWSCIHKWSQRYIHMMCSISAPSLRNLHLLSNRPTCYTDRF